MRAVSKIWHSCPETEPTFREISLRASSPEIKDGHVLSGEGEQKQVQEHPAAKHTRRSQPCFCPYWLGGSLSQAFRPPSTGRLVSPWPRANPKPSPPYTWPLFVSFRIQGVVTAVPKTVAFGAGTLLQNRQRNKPSARGGSEGGLVEQRGLWGLGQGAAIVIKGRGSTETRVVTGPDILRTNRLACLPTRKVATVRRLWARREEN